jgi:hypothetical protein
MRKDKRTKGARNNMTNAETNDKAATVAEQGAHDGPKKPYSKKGATRKKSAPKSQKTAMRVKANSASNSRANASKNAGKTKRRATASHPESKGARILALIGRPKGASIAEIMKATAWQAHSVRGFLSTAAKMRGIKIGSARSESGDRIYTIVM